MIKILVTRNSCFKSRTCQNLSVQRKKFSISSRQETKKFTHSSKWNVSLDLWSVPSNFEVIKLETLFYSSSGGRILPFRKRRDMLLWVLTDKS